MSQSTSQAASRDVIAAQIIRRQRKGDKEAKYNEMKCFRSFQEFSDWWTRDEGRTWKVNSRRSHPRGYVEYWRCKVKTLIKAYYE
jgi:P2-related tail formation protein